jgi:hypothetical protein
MWGVTDIPNIATVRRAPTSPYKVLGGVCVKGLHARDPYIKVVKLMPHAWLAAEAEARRSEGLSLRLR